MTCSLPDSGSPSPLLDVHDLSVRAGITSGHIRYRRKLDEREIDLAALADRILIAYAEKGGKTEALCKEALTQGKSVFAIDSPDNAHLVDLGIAPVQAEALAPLL